MSGLAFQFISQHFLSKSAMGWGQSAGIGGRSLLLQILHTRLCGIVASSKGMSVVHSSQTTTPKAYISYDGDSTLSRKSSSAIQA